MRKILNWKHMIAGCAILGAAACAFLLWPQTPPAKPATPQAKAPARPPAGPADSRGRLAQQLLASAKWDENAIPEVVFIEGGEFVCQDDPIKKVTAQRYTVRPFYIGRYEITMGQFYAFCNETGYYASRYGSMPGPLHRSGSAQRIEKSLKGDDSELRPQDWPATNVCWQDAMAYCAWLSEKTGVQYRLPLQAEWEFACTAGGKEYLGQIPESNLKEIARFKMTRQAEPSLYLPVGSRRPNSVGLYDMLGNVWEWCFDGPDYSTEEVNSAVQALASLSWKTFLNGSQASPALFKGRHPLRGGAITEDLIRTNSWFRMYYGVSYDDERVGFRIACSADNNKPKRVATVVDAAPLLSATPPVLVPQADQTPPPLNHAEQRANAQPIPAEKLDELMQRYAELVGENLEKYPVLEWRDEIQEMDAYNDRMLSLSRQDQALRDSLSPELREEFFKIRDLATKASMRQYDGSEPEVQLALAKYLSQAEDQSYAPIKQKAEEAHKELQALIAQSSLPEELLWRAQYGGAVEGRRSVLSAALAQVEPPGAGGIGHRIQVLRVRAGLNTSHSRVLQDFPIDFGD